MRNHHVLLREALSRCHGGLSASSTPEHLNYPEVDGDFRLRSFHIGRMPAYQTGLDVRLPYSSRRASPIASPDPRSGAPE